MIRNLYCVLVSCLLSVALAYSQSDADTHSVMLPTSKVLTVPAPGRLASTNSYPSTIVLSPDVHYAALLDGGYGTQETLAHQSIAILNLDTDKIADFPDARFGEEAHQSYFLGLAFSSDGKHLYASVGSLSDPTGTNSGNTGNGIAVYSFAHGKIAPQRFIRIPLQPLSSGKSLPVGMSAPAHKAIPYPAGLALISEGGHDKLLIANNLSDNVVLLDPSSGKILQTFDLSTREIVPSSYPYTCVATRDGRRAWCSLWNASQVAELDLTSGKVARWIKLKEPDDPQAPGSHPTAMLLSPSEKTLYVTLSNIDQIAQVSTESGTPFAFKTVSLAEQKAPGNSPIALAQSADGKLLFVANASLDAIAAFDVAPTMNGSAGGPETNSLMGFIPTDWYPSALAIRGDDLLIAAAKGQGTGPNKAMEKLPTRRNTATILTFRR